MICRDLGVDCGDGEGDADGGIEGLLWGNLLDGQLNELLKKGLGGGVLGGGAGKKVGMDMEKFWYDDGRVVGVGGEYGMLKAVGVGVKGRWLGKRGEEGLECEKVADSDGRGEGGGGRS